MLVRIKVSVLSVLRGDKMRIKEKDERIVRFGRECTERYARQDQEVRRCTDPTERMRRRRRWAMRE